MATRARQSISTCCESPVTFRRTTLRRYPFAAGGTAGLMASRLLAHLVWPGRCHHPAAVTVNDQPGSMHESRLRSTGDRGVPRPMALLLSLWVSYGFVVG